VLGNGVNPGGQVGRGPNRAVIGRSGHCLLQSGDPGEIAAGEVVSGLPGDPEPAVVALLRVFHKLPELAPQRAPAEGRSRASSGGTLTHKGGRANPAGNLLIDQRPATCMTSYRIPLLPGDAIGPEINGGGPGAAGCR